jgi:pSer/pThr/pTyr-binding forkhead associated (FHA) protein
MKWRHDQPWGYMTDLLNGRVYPLDGDTAWIGRGSFFITNAVNVRPNVVSRIHLVISRGRQALDVRSLNGTTVNARFLQYSTVRELRDGDLIALAGVALFSFIAVEPPLLPFTQQSSKRSPAALPKEAWAVLIDGGSRKTMPLVLKENFLGIDNNRVTKLTTIKESTSVLRIERKPDEGLSLCVRDHKML